MKVDTCGPVAGDERKNAESFVRSWCYVADASEMRRIWGELGPKRLSQAERILWLCANGIREGRRWPKSDPGKLSNGSHRQERMLVRGKKKGGEKKGEQNNNNEA